MNEEIKKVLDAIGAMCELAGFMREQLMVNGFTREEACSMSLEYIMELSIHHKEDP